jgi:hypothetical protein
MPLDSLTLLYPSIGGLWRDLCPDQGVPFQDLDRKTTGADEPKEPWRLPKFTAKEFMQIYIPTFVIMW